MQSEPIVQTNERENFGRYQQMKRVGRGGMGEVWLCEDTLLHRQVAIKTLPPHSLQDEDYATRFEREAQAAAALNHPHILPVHDYGRQPLPHGKLMTYLVMPYIAGGSLADMIKLLVSKGQGMVQDKALLFLSQAADAIDHAHTQGMVHRDIKPANMLLRSDDWLLLTDFGVVQIVSSNDSFTEQGMIVGTPLYMAPEQARGHAEAASDMYSLAVIAYQLFVGRPPFHGETSFATIMQHMLLPPPAPRQFHPDLPVACEEVLLRGLAKQPAERYPSARAFVDELKRTLGVAVSEPPPIAAQTVTNMHTTRRRAVLIGTGAGLVAIGTGASVWALAANRNTSPPSKATPKREMPTMVLREHLAPPSVLTWIPNKNVLTSTSDDDTTIKLWDIDSFRYRQQPEYESTKSIKIPGTNIHLSWSPDGQYLAVANSHVSDFSDYIDIYQADLNNLVGGFENGILMPKSSSVYGLGWLQSSFPIAIWDALDLDEAFYLGMWDITKPTQNPQPLLMQGLLTLVSTDIKAQSMAIAPDHLQVAIGIYKGVLTGTVVVKNNKVTWEPGRSPLRTRKNIPNSGSADLLSWGFGGKRLMGILNDGFITTIIGWDMLSQSDDLLRFGIPADAGDFTMLATHPSATSTMFAAGTKNGQIYLWSGDTNKLPLHTLVSPDISAEIVALSWSPDGQWLAASYNDIDATILVWKV